MKNNRFRPQEKEVRRIKTATYSYYTMMDDSYFKVPLKDIKLLGLANKISEKSKFDIKSMSVLLQEKDDLHLFLKAIGITEEGDWNVFKRYGVKVFANHMETEFIKKLPKYKQKKAKTQSYDEWWNEKNLDGSFAYNGVTDDF